LSSDHGHHPAPPSDLAARTLALESLLVEKGLLTHDAVDRVIDAFEHDIGPMHGARVVARAWVDPQFKQRLLTSARDAVREVGIEAATVHELAVVENTPQVHNVIVCTLCSCYPWDVLGLPPTWYKSAPYRSRVVLEPRTVLAEMGLSVPPAVDVRVWDSSADMRYMVLPERPVGSEGMTEEELTALVTRDAMIGVARVASPARVA
jgi:nitrile hydratase subunit alpha